MRLSFSLLGGLIFVAGLPTASLGQGPATSVQLPTWSAFSTSTTVVVPDNGSTLLGGVSRASSGRNEFGTPLLPLRNSSIGSERSVSSMRVTAQIHDFEAMEQAILSQGGPEPVARTAPATAAIAPRSSGAGSSWLVRGEPSADHAPVSLADVQAQRAGKKAVAANEAAAFFERGQKAEAEGKLGVAKIYYQMALRRADGELRDRAQARLNVLGPQASKASQLVDTGR